MAACAVEDCERPVRSRGLCNAHHLKLLRYGDPMFEKTWLSRFWAKASLDSTTECQEWTGHRKQSQWNYGIIDCDINDERKSRRAHIVMWELLHGPVPKGMFVCHRCDNPPCVRIGHLFLGTHEQNMNDMVTKGRSVTCGRNH